jgi:hypothetical protein
LAEASDWAGLFDLAGVSHGQRQSRLAPAVAKSPQLASRETTIDGVTVTVVAIGWL